MACDWLSALSLRGMVSPGDDTDVELETDGGMFIMEVKNANGQA